MARLLFFGKLGDIAGGRAREYALPPGVETVALLAVALGADDQMLAAALTENSVRFVVNDAFATADATINDSDEIAFLPPVSGG